MIDHGTRNVLGLPIAAVDYDAAVARVIAAGKRNTTYAVSALAVHGVMTGVLDEAHGYRLSQFEMLVPDGQPVRWALRWLHGLSLPDRVYGPNLMLRTCEAAANEQLPIFLFGSTQQTLDLLSANLKEMFPDLIIAGFHPSQFRQLSEPEKHNVVEQIRNSGAQICFCGLGCPRQEVWAFEYRKALSMPILAVGAAFDFHAGTLAQAPPWLQRNGLEWAFRFLKEPSRLWRRYVYLNPLYLSLILLQWTKLRRRDTANNRPPVEELRYG